VACGAHWFVHGEGFDSGLHLSSVSVRSRLIADCKVNAVAVHADIQFMCKITTRAYEQGYYASQCTCRFLGR
jgi:hypothetical protein